MHQHNDDRAFNFSLDKTVYFKPGDAISEMRKISLEPDILITPENDYVNINGFIMLQGQYERLVNQTAVRADLNENELDIVENLTELEDGLIQFDYRFPVDITVPAERVTDLSNVSVAIESFDYELKDQNELMITSNIEIDGIYFEGPSQMSEFDEDEAQMMEHQERIDESQMDKIKETSYEEERTEFEINEVTPLPQAQNEFDSQESVSEVQDENVIEIDDEQREILSINENELNDEEVVISREGDTEEKEINTTLEEDEADEQSIDIQVKESEEEDNTEIEDLHFLTTIFNRDEEEQESFSQLRIYIVQEGDSVHSIADHYNISTLKLLQLNQLTDEDIGTGKLLYIPEKKESKS